MKNKKAIVAAALAAAVLLTSCAGGDSLSGSKPASSQSASSAQENTAGVLSAFSAIDLDGNEIDQTVLSEKKLTMINVWATYCGPCLREMPDLGKLAAEYAEKDVQIIGIAMDTLNRDGTVNEEQREYAKELTVQTGADSYLHLLPSESLISAKLSSVTAVPTTFFVDAEGREVGKAVLGSKTADDWRSIIDSRLAQIEE